MAEGVDPEAVRTAVIAARTSPPLAADWEAGANIFYTQMLSLATPRLFLPQARVDISYTGALIDAALASWQQG
jgi:hypothetical protein